MMNILKDYVLIKDITEATFTEGGFEVPVDLRELPTCEVVLISDAVKLEGVVSIGDRCYYILPREKGIVKHNGESHYLVPVSTLVAIL